LNVEVNIDGVVVDFDLGLGERVCALMWGRVSKGITEEGKHAYSDFDGAPTEGEQIPCKDAQCAELQVRNSAVEVKQVNRSLGVSCVVKKFHDWS